MALLALARSLHKTTWVPSVRLELLKQVGAGEKPAFMLGHDNRRDQYQGPVGLFVREIAAVMPYPQGDSTAAVHFEKGLGISVSSSISHTIDSIPFPLSRNRAQGPEGNARMGTRG